MKPFLTALCLALICVSCLPDNHGELSDEEFSLLTSKLQNGDIIFHTSKSLQSKAIQLATKSKYSHCGLIFFKDNKPYVLEAINTVQYTPLDKWISRGVQGGFVVKRLSVITSQLSASEANKLRTEAEKFAGKRYDLTFEWNNDKIYCSELIWKAYHNALKIDVGKLQRLKDFDLSHPAVQAKLKELYGEKIPWDETVVSPVAIFENALLSQVYATSWQ